MIVRTRKPPQPPLWRAFLYDVVRASVWIAVGFAAVLALAVAGLELGQAFPYYWVHR